MFSADGALIKREGFDDILKSEELKLRFQTDILGADEFPDTGLLFDKAYDHSQKGQEFMNGIKRLIQNGGLDEL